MLPGGVKGGAPTANRWVGALQGVMAKLLTVGALGVLVEAKVSLQLEGGGEGRQARRGGKVLCPGASDGDNDSGHGFVGAMVVRGKPSGSLREGEARVESGDLPGNRVQGVSGWDSVHEELCGGVIQKDGGGTWDEVQKLLHPAAKRGYPNRVHGNEGDVVVGAADDALDEGGLQGSVDAVPNRDHGGAEG